MPAALRDEIDEAGRALVENWDTPPPVTFAFVEVRCRADGHMLIVFKGTSGPPSGTIATATSRSDARQPWELAYAVDDLSGDIARFFEESPEAQCPA